MKFFLCETFYNSSTCTIQVHILNVHDNFLIISQSKWPSVGTSSNGDLLGYLCVSFHERESFREVELRKHLVMMHSECIKEKAYLV